MGTIHLAGSVACFIIGGLVMLICGFLAITTSSNFENIKIDMGRMAVVGFFIVAAGVIIAIKSKN